MLKNEMSYKVLKCVYTPIVKGKFKLSTNNEQLVPSSGPVIICCNHLHKRDQLAIYYSIKRPIHFMAKKEYFESQPTKTFYKMWGAIPTDRHNGKEAMETCESILNSGGCVGIFPEGTRNYLKDNEILDFYQKNNLNKYCTFERFYGICKRLNPKASQMQFLQQLFSKGIINFTDIIDILNLGIDKFLESLKFAGIISSEQYDDTLLLPIRFGAVKLAQKTGATIITSASDGEFDSGKVNFSYGDSIIIPNGASDNSLSYYNDELRKSLIKTYKKVK